MLRFMHKWLTHNIWLKLIALFLAIISWIYINDEVRGRSVTGMPSFLSRFVQHDPMVSKEVPINANIKGKPAHGYNVHYENIVFMPSNCMIWGRRSVLKKVKSVYTKTIDVDKKTRTFTVHVRLKTIPDVVLPQSTVVKVKIPIISNE